MPIVSIAIGMFLLAGLWTPLAGALLAATELWAAFARGNNASFHLLLAALGVSLMMLGPGTWSIDAQLFGRKRIDIQRLWSRPSMRHIPVCMRRPADFSFRRLRVFPMRSSNEGEPQSLFDCRRLG